MSDFIPGQRYISDGEAELGLGTILNVDFRSVTVLFGASDETRTYSSKDAPLTRVAFGSGDRVEATDGWILIVEDTKDQNGLITYIGEDEHGELRELPEPKISDKMQFHQARDRLLTGQIDRNDWFNLRYRSLQCLNRLQRHPAFGLSGPRVDLVPHQLFIADDVSRRRLPRVLLSDEVGLGKTIEAGLILHRLLTIGRASRALIVVPESLTHQWLVELLRRFSIEVTLLDEQQSGAMERTQNPFESRQLILASQQWLFANPHRQEQAAQSSWDLLIVDEAHHLEWSSDTGGDTGYQCVEQLAAASQGVLLLTATPEQMGPESHFARLRLLDPNRYTDLERFQAEEANFQGVAGAVEALDHYPAEPGKRKVLDELLDDADSQGLLDRLAEAEEEDAVACRQSLRRHLLDRHGTGRVMFRNSRRHVAGFPERRLHVSELEAPSNYQRILKKLDRDEEYLDTLLIETGIDHPEVLLYLEETLSALDRERMSGDGTPWWKTDTRVEWLTQWLKEHPGEKALLICHFAETARELSAGLQVLTGLHVPVFHEGMTLIERDRAAAAFAEQDATEGSPLLICSEIGSEGRNFQFCHHLIMFDLPPHPDQLEQRIGRLDRIGQRYPIDIHLPVFKESPMARLLRWYNEGSDAFSFPHGIGSALFDEFGDRLADSLLDDEALEELIAETRPRFEAIQAERLAGRNRLLELGSQNPAHAEHVIDNIRDLDDDPTLPKFLDQAFDIFGIDTRELGENLTYLHPGPHMMDGLPGLIKGEEGFTATQSRELALSRDDIQRLSWEHPLVQEMLSHLTMGAMGNTALGLLQHPSIPGDRVMLEAIFCTSTPAPKNIHVGQYLPPTTVRVLIDQSGKDLSASVSFGGLAKNLQHVKKGIARNLIKDRHTLVRDLMDQAEQHADASLKSVVNDAHAEMSDTLDAEIDRLTALSQRFGSVPEAEVDLMRQEKAQLSDAIRTSRLRLDAVRVILTVDVPA
ncbi:RNA polymerase-associated protein RapA [Larsenimonas suaedae]|uniref:RNA polymerase-associated protein RapA n=1 Tax=Larsenimonas suaedae TaxID=1851019 RepID=A0ABU1GYR0_9GAMM|nr:RNA polymerase-associated protein RapA [Larsenimonas suaedae]MCM2973679.1 RNA polymerase-associated protein RapA [Larsenimonas suaedae]MDR5897187.1 RNA polymerase-associated protein RapA [Larsenimonas suaedae]